MSLIDRLKQEFPAFWVIAIAALCGTYAGTQYLPLQVVTMILLVGGGIAAAVLSLHSPQHLPSSLYPLTMWIIVLVISMLAAGDVSRGLPVVVTWIGIVTAFWISSRLGNARLEQATMAVLAAMVLIAIYQEAAWWIFSGFPIEIPPRPTSVLYNPNNLGAVLMVGMTLATKQRKWGWLVVFLFAMALSASRTSMLGALAGAMLFAVLTIRQFTINRTILLSGLTIGLILLPFLVVGFFFNPTHGTTAQRVELWSIAIRTFMSHPLVGIGPGRYILAFLKMATLEHGRVQPFAHNTYLHVAAETGLLGLGALTWLISVCGITVIKTYRSSRTQSVQVQRLAALGAALMVALMVHGLTDYVYWLPANVLLALWGGRVVLGKPMEIAESSRQIHRMNKTTVWIAGIGFVISLATLALDTQAPVYMLWTTVLGCVIAGLLYLISCPPHLDSAHHAAEPEKPPASSGEIGKAE